MPESPKEFLKLQREGIGPVEQAPNGARIVFLASNGIKCRLQEFEDELVLSPALSVTVESVDELVFSPAFSINLTRKQAYQLVNTLQRWIKTNHLG